MRILCCANRDLESAFALNLLLRDLTKYTTRVVLSDRVGRRTSATALAGLHAIEQTIPNELIFPIVERCVPATGRLLTFNELATLCDGAPVIVEDLNSETGMELLRTFAPDLVVTLRYGHILRQPAILAARLGVINLHSGILPHYRGILSTLYAMAAGHSEIGCTLHWIVDAGIDTGPIIAVARRPVEQGRSLLWHVLSLYPLGVPLIVEAIRRLTIGEELPHSPQAPGEGVYRSLPADTDVAALRARGFELFDAADMREILAAYAPLPLAPRREPHAS